jgi:hypothetical protein
MQTAIKPYKKIKPIQSILLLVIDSINVHLYGMSSVEGENSYGKIFWN